jgi:universal stress protein E
MAKGDTMSRRNWKSFLVAVREIDRPPRALLTKAARIARRFGGKLELLHVIAHPYVVPGDVSGGEQVMTAEVSRQKEQLERVARRLRRAGLKVECSVVWDYPASDAIVRYVLKSKPDILLAESHRHSKLSRWFVAHTDWELIRSCPCPLWLIKTPRLVDRLRVLTAVDPFHAHSKPVALDDELLRVAKVLTGKSGRAGVSHVYPLPITMAAGGLGEPIWVNPPAQELKRAKQRVSATVDAVAERFGITRSNRIVQAGDPALELPTIVNHWKAHVLVMGAVSRSALKRAFIGHTAERVIDAVQCDVLIVKPLAFKSPVNRKRNAAVIPVPPI